MTDRPARDWEDTLRAVGALLNAEEVRLISLTELRDGLALGVTARGTPYLTELSAERLDSICAHAKRLRVERDLGWADQRLLPPGITGGFADRRAPRRNYEEALRAVGRTIMQQGKRSFVLAEIRPGFALFSLAPRVAADGRTQIWDHDEDLWTNAELAEMADLAVARRGRDGR